MDMRIRLMHCTLCSYTWLHCCLPRSIYHLPHAAPTPAKPALSAANTCCAPPRLLHTSRAPAIPLRGAAPLPLLHSRQRTRIMAQRSHLASTLARLHLVENTHHSCLHTHLYPPGMLPTFLPLLASSTLPCLPCHCPAALAFTLPASPHAYLCFPCLPACFLPSNMFLPASCLLYSVTSSGVTRFCGCLLLWTGMGGSWGESSIASKNRASTRLPRRRSCCAALRAWRLPWPLLSQTFSALWARNISWAKRGNGIATDDWNIVVRLGGGAPRCCAKTRRYANALEAG